MFGASVGKRMVDKQKTLQRRTYAYLVRSDFPLDSGIIISACY